MKINLSDVLEFIGEDNHSVVGYSEQPVFGVASIYDADIGDLTFCKKSGDASSLLQNTKASIVICDSEIDVNTVNDKTLILVKNPRLWFIRCMKHFFYTDGNAPSVHPDATVNWSVVSIGERVKIGAGARIGFDGFGYEKNEDGAWEKFPHMGGVIIGDDVEIGKNTCIDRGSLGNTIIGRGTKIDNLVHIAHNALIGEDCIIVCLSCIAGSSQIGDNSWIAPGVIIRDGKKVGENVLVGMGSIVTKDVEDGVTVVGNPARKFERRC